MDITEYINSGSDYMRKEDFPKPELLTISGASVEKVGEDERLIIHFKESEKSLVANKTNLQLLAVFYGSDDTDDWMAKKVVLWNDPTVMYGGKPIGGIRVRLPKGVDPIPPSVPQATPADFDDDCPF